MTTPIHSPNPHHTAGTGEPAMPSAESILATMVRTLDTISSRLTTPVVTPIRDHAPDFTGNPKHFKEFISKLEICFTAHPSAFTTDSAKVLYAINRLKGKAFTWANVRMDSRLPVWSDNYSLFKQELEATFDFNWNATAASNKLFNFYQGRRSVFDYANEMCQLLDEANWDRDGDPALTAFKRGLNPEIYDLLLGRPEPVTLNSFIELALELEQSINLHRQHRSNRKSQFNPRSGNSSRNQTTAFPSRRQDSYVQPTHYTAPTGAPKSNDPMNIDTIRVRRGPLTAAEHAERKRKGLCMYCGKSGHMLPNCPSRPPKKY